MKAKVHAMYKCGLNYRIYSSLIRSSHGRHTVLILKITTCRASSSFIWTSVANVPNVLQPYWLIVPPLDVPDLIAILLL